MDIHKREKKLEYVIRKLKNDKELSDKNKRLILAFKDKVFTQGLSVARALFYIEKLPKIALALGKDFDQATRDDIERIVKDLETSDYAAWTKAGYRITIKKFYQWLEGYEWKSKEYPDKVKWVSTTVNNNNHKLPSDILTPEEINKMIRMASNPRDKAFVSMLYESGCRISELANVKIKDIQFDKYGAIVFVSGKTGDRRIRLIISVLYLESWLSYHPTKEDSDSYLFVSYANNNKGRPLTYQTFRRILIKLAKRACINKPVNPHIFRHTRATHLANKLTEAQMNVIFGWRQGSKMPATYVHMSGRDIDKALLKIYGKFTDEENDDYIKCPRCGENNALPNRFCGRCGMPFDLQDVIKKEEERQKYDEMMSKIMEKLVKNSNVKKELIKILHESEKYDSFQKFTNPP